MQAPHQGLVGTLMDASAGASAWVGSALGIHHAQEPAVRNHVDVVFLLPSVKQEICSRVG